MSVGWWPETLCGTYIYIYVVKIVGLYQLLRSTIHTTKFVVVKVSLKWCLCVICMSRAYLNWCNNHILQRKQAYGPDSHAIRTKKYFDAPEYARFSIDFTYIQYVNECVGPVPEWREFKKGFRFDDNSTRLYVRCATYNKLKAEFSDNLRVKGIYLWAANQYGGRSAQYL